jgi:hypothetical protein
MHADVIVLMAVWIGTLPGDPSPSTNLDSVNKQTNDGVSSLDAERQKCMYPWLDILTTAFSTPATVETAFAN